MKVRSAKSEVRRQEPPRSVGRRPSAVSRRRVLVVFGTRPEAIKLAPVIAELKSRPKRFKVCVAVTAQHRRMLDQVLSVFDIKPDFDLDVMRQGQTPSEVLARVLEGVDRVLEKTRPDIVLVQGDTTSALAASLAAYHRRIAVGHVEAGLRTHDKYAPFPEEMNRTLISSIADLHFAPTKQARANLLSEGIPSSSIHVTGNTVIDALHLVLAAASRGARDMNALRPAQFLLFSIRIASQARKAAREPKTFNPKSMGSVAAVPQSKIQNPKSKILLVTAHRRESFGPGFERICRALARIVRDNADVEVIYPVHLNPNVRGPVRKFLSGLERVHLIEPLEYLEFCHLMQAAYLILTDSGGIQEEAPALGKPVLVLRDKTERPEAINAGTAKLVGTDVERIVSATQRLLHSRVAYRKMAKAKNPFGDGHAAKRIAQILLNLEGR